MQFKPMDPELALKLVEGYQDELAPERKKLDAFYRQCRCPRCKKECQKEAAAGHVFPAWGTSGESLVARSLLRCLHCRCLFDPHSDLVLERGDPVPGIPLVSPR